MNIKEAAAGIEQKRDEPTRQSEERLLSSEQQNALYQLERPMEKILEQLRQEIERSTYAVIIGDDASGRIPTRMMEKILKRIYKRKNTNPPIVRFIAGSSQLQFRSTDEQERKKAAIKKQIASIKRAFPNNSWSEKRVLIVTDTIWYGRSLDVLMTALQQNHMPADIATISLYDNKTKKVLEEKWGTKIVLGMLDNAPLIYAGGSGQIAAMHGVYKDSADVFSHRFAKSALSDSNAAREIAFKIADRLTKKFEQQSK